MKRIPVPLSPEQIHDVVVAAREVRLRSYSPYSEFPVGAALLTGDGHIFVGTNVENASLGLTTCAERSAIAAAISAGDQTFQAMAISLSGEPLPCGACRQVLAEFNPAITLLLDNIDTAVHDVQIVSLEELLPRPFLVNPDA